MMQLLIKLGFSIADIDYHVQTFDFLAPTHLKIIRLFNHSKPNKLL